MKKTSNETAYEKISDLTRLVKIRKEYFLTFLGQWLRNLKAQGFFKRAVSA